MSVKMSVVIQILCRNLAVKLSTYRFLDCEKLINARVREAYKSTLEPTMIGSSRILRVQHPHQSKLHLPGTTIPYDHNLHLI